MMSSMNLEDLPVDVLPMICENLSIQDIRNLSKVNSNMAAVIERIILSKMNSIRFEISSDESKIEFKQRASSWNSSLDMRLSDEWADIVRLSRRIRNVEIDVAKDSSTSHIFSVIKKSNLQLKSLKFNIRNGQNKEKINRLHNNCINLVSQHRLTLNHLEASTSDGQHISVEINSKINRTTLDYCQGKKAEEKDHIEYSKNNLLAYNLFHSLLEFRPSSEVVLGIEAGFDANFALQKAFQIAIPHSNRKALKFLTIEFGKSLEKADEEETKKVLFRHIDEFHFTLPNIQHFTCNLPHGSINISLENLNNEIRDQIQKTRKSPKSYTSTIGLRAVRCQ